MSEISKEEVIKNLKYIQNRYKLFGCAEESVIKKAISDMEKLQKIEALYEQQEFGKGISREERDKEVQKILESE